MNQVNNRPLKTYVRPTDVLNPYTISADEFVLMLLDNSMMKIDNAIEALNMNKNAEFGFHVGRTTAIIDHLRDRLANLESSEIAATLALHYQTIDGHLQEAVIKTTKSELLYAKLILKQIRNFWAELLSYHPNQEPIMSLQ